MGTPEEDAQRAERQTADRTARVLRGLLEQAQAQRSVGFHVPTVDEDPPVEDPTNMWRFDDGRLRTRGDDGVVHEFLPVDALQYRIRTLASNPAPSTGIDFWLDGPSGELRARLGNGSIVRFAPITATSSAVGGGNATGSATTAKPKPVQQAPKRYRKVYGATWGRTLCPQHGAEGGANLRYGYYSATHGQRRIMLGLPDTTIRADLAGATIRRVQLHLRNTDAFDHSGITISFGAHNRHDPPGSFSAVRRGAWSGQWPEAGDGAGWRTIPDWFGRALRDNQIKGITVDQGSTSRSRYGELDWSSFKLAIDYTR